MLNNHDHISLVENYLEKINVEYQCLYNRIEIYGDGKKMIPIIFLDDLIIKINKLLISKINEPINLCSKNISISNIAKKIISEKGNKKSKIIFSNHKVSYNKNFYIDFKLAKKL